MSQLQLRNMDKTIRRRTNRKQQQSQHLKTTHVNRNLVHTNFNQQKATSFYSMHFDIDSDKNMFYHMSFNQIEKFVYTSIHEITSIEHISIETFESNLVQCLHLVTFLYSRINQSKKIKDQSIMRKLFFNRELVNTKEIQQFHEWIKGFDFLDSTLFVFDLIVYFLIIWFKMSHSQKLYERKDPKTQGEIYGKCKEKEAQQISDFVLSTFKTLAVYCKVLNRSKDAYDKNLTNYVIKYIYDVIEQYRESFTSLQLA